MANHDWNDRLDFLDLSESLVSSLKSALTRRKRANQRIHLTAAEADELVADIRNELEFYVEPAE